LSTAAGDSSYIKRSRPNNLIESTAKARKKISGKQSANFTRNSGSRPLMENKIKLSDLREKHAAAPSRPKKLRFFWELKSESQNAAVAAERTSPDRFDYDDAAILSEDFKIQLAERGFSDVKVFWSLGYCQGDGVAFYGSVYPEDLKEKDPQAAKFIKALEKAGDVLSIAITGENNHYHHWNSMTVEIEFESETDDDEQPPRLKIARPVLRENLEEHLSEKVKEISRELEKAGYAEIEYKSDEETIRRDLSEREHLYEKDGLRRMDEFEFHEWSKAERNQTARLEKVCC
jgi:hypothetical protein